MVLRTLLGIDLSVQLAELPDPYASPLNFSIYFSVGVGLGAFAGICSGLTLGLLSMSRVDLEVLRRTGTDHEKRCAERIIPVVKDQHYLLVTLLLCNAFAAEALPLVIDRMANPVVAVILSMTVLLVMGEIIPQAICKHHALDIGAACTPLCHALKFLTAPISWPIAKFLDLILGEGHAAMFRRAQLEEFVDIHSAEEGMGGDLSVKEVSIMKGALAFSTKVAKQAMTPINKVFMLSSNTILSRSTFNKILATGHSRIPVYNGEDRNDIVGVILVKELVGINPEDRVPITHVTLRSLPVVSEDTPMYDMMELFETGRSHLALLMANLPVNATCTVGGPVRTTTKSNAKLVQSESSLPPQRRKNSSKQGRAERSPEEEEDSSAVKINISESAWAVVKPEDELQPRVDSAESETLPEPIPAGIITIEDCIEELIQDEIIDETDRYVDNVQSQRVTAAALVSRLPVRLRSDFLKHFVPRSTGNHSQEQNPSNRVASREIRHTVSQPQIPYEDGVEQQNAGVRQPLLSCASLPRVTEG